MDRLVEELLYSLPAVFIQSEVVKVKQELTSLGEMASRFRASCKVSWGEMQRRYCD